MNDNPSERLVEQRLRNRIMEQLHHLVNWRETVRDWGAGEYFESFFDFVPYEGLEENSALTPEERAAIEEVRRLVVAACDETPKMVTREQLMATDWPLRIEPVARRTLVHMWERGQFSEEQEEEAPSQRKAWEGYAAED